MPLQRDRPQLRATGLLALEDEDLIRFGTTEPHQVIKAALATSDLYDDVLAVLDRPRPRAVLACSTFALTATCAPSQLAEGTEYTSYYTVSAGALRQLSADLGLGYELWPTDTCAFGDPDPRDPVHFDVVVAVIPPDDVADRSGTPTQRRVLRQRLLPRFAPLLDALDGPHPLTGDHGRYP